MQAMYAFPNVFQDDNWYPDLEATNDLTPNAGNLMQSAEFTGPDRVHIRDASGLSIKHVGQSSFVSPYCSKFLSLSNLLHVPKLTTNLLSVSKFARDNNVFFEFHPRVCFVKDQVTKSIFLAGKVKDGLYSFQSSSMLLKPTQFFSSSSLCV